jgi:hypothetical protein
MDLTPVIEALQATLAPHIRKQAEEKLAEVRCIISNLIFNKDSFVVLQNIRFYPMSCSNYSQ